MGVLDDAIRDHLELKRRHGADPGEVAHLERRALGGEGDARVGAPHDSTQDGASNDGADAFARSPRLHDDALHPREAAVTHADPKESAGVVGMAAVAARVERRAEGRSGEADAHRGGTGDETIEIDMSSPIEGDRDSAPAGRSSER